jgi:hypothetical protein
LIPRNDQQDYFPESGKNAQAKTRDYLRGGGMSQLSSALLIVTGLLLTVYFGTAAWRASGPDVTGSTSRTSTDLR